MGARARRNRETDARVTAGTVLRSAIALACDGKDAGLAAAFWRPNGVYRICRRALSALAATLSATKKPCGVARLAWMDVILYPRARGSGSAEPGMAARVTAVRVRVP